MSCRHALILAAGKGERLRPITDKTPKPLIQAGKFRLIEYHIMNLRNAGIRQVYINRAHLRDQFETLLEPDHFSGIEINFLDEPDGALETAGAIINAFETIKTDRIIVVNGDIWTNYNFNDIIYLPDKFNDNAHLILTTNPAHNPAGDFSLEGDRLTEPVSGCQTFTFTGIGIYRRKMFEAYSVKFMKLAPLIRQQIQLKSISASLSSKIWMDIGTLKRLQALRSYLNSAPDGIWHQFENSRTG